MNTLINSAFVSITKRAEQEIDTKLINTFVDAGALAPLLISKDHQIIFGRRGTGKTHALRYLHKLATKDIVLFLDMRQIGSSGGIFNDTELSLATRATHLLVDTLIEIHSKLLKAIQDDESVDLSRIVPYLDEYIEVATKVKVSGKVRTDITQKSYSSRTDRDTASLSIDPISPKAQLTSGETEEHGRSNQSFVSVEGHSEHTVHFGSLGSALHKILGCISPRRLWIAIDEWSAIPRDLQPYLADLLRRTLFATYGVTVKIAAIELRSTFQISNGSGNYIGIEMGSDISANVSLDDFMVFDNNKHRALKFFEELIFKHYSANAQPNATQFVHAAALRSQAFSDIRAFEELVRAAEGVPRDAINILGMAAQAAGDSRISVSMIRDAARKWYQRDKERAVPAEAASLLQWIVDEVIGVRRARSFLLASDSQEPLIDQLFDSRVLHILKRQISSPEEPGKRYVVYKLDYGCYVDLIGTKRAVGPTFRSGDAPSDALVKPVSPESVEVPEDDYRAIRRAVLNPSDFHNRPIPLRPFQL